MATYGDSTQKEPIAKYSQDNWKTVAAECIFANKLCQCKWAFKRYFWISIKCALIYNNLRLIIDIHFYANFTTFCQ
jgi:hypothetical protein